MYKEDVDLSWRLRLAGWECWYVPRALAYHARTSSAPAGGVPLGHPLLPRERACEAAPCPHALDEEPVAHARQERGRVEPRPRPALHRSAVRALVLGYNTLFAPQVTASAHSADSSRCFPRRSRAAARSRRSSSSHPATCGSGSSPKPVKRRSFAEADGTPACRPRVASPHRSRPAAPRAPSPPRRRR